MADAKSQVYGGKEGSGLAQIFEPNNNLAAFFQKIDDIEKGKKAKKAADIDAALSFEVDPSRNWSPEIFTETQAHMDDVAGRISRGEPVNTVNDKMLQQRLTHKAKKSQMVQERYDEVQAMSPEEMFGANAEFMDMAVIKQLDREAHLDANGNVVPIEGWTENGNTASFNDSRAFKYNAFFKKVQEGMGVNWDMTQSEIDQSGNGEYISKVNDKMRFAKMRKAQDVSENSIASLATTGELGHQDVALAQEAMLMEEGDRTTEQQAALTKAEELLGKDTMVAGQSDGMWDMIRQEPAYAPIIKQYQKNFSDEITSQAMALGKTSNTAEGKVIIKAIEDMFDTTTQEGQAKADDLIRRLKNKEIAAKVEFEGLISGYAEGASRDYTEAMLMGFQEQSHGEALQSSFKTPNSLDYFKAETGRIAANASKQRAATGKRAQGLKEIKFHGDEVGRGFISVDRMVDGKKVTTRMYSDIGVAAELIDKKDTNPFVAIQPTEIFTVGDKDGNSIGKYDQFGKDGVKEIEFNPMSQGASLYAVDNNGKLLGDTDGSVIRNPKDQQYRAFFKGKDKAGNIVLVPYESMDQASAGKYKWNRGKLKEQMAERNMWGGQFAGAHSVEEAEADTSDLEDSEEGDLSGL
jgi:hypothetical protein